MSSQTTSGDVVTGEDIVDEIDVEPVPAPRNPQTMFSLADSQVGLPPYDNVECNHTYWYGDDDRRLYALEPDPETGYWLCCPECGLQLGQTNEGEVPSELRTI